MKDQPLPALMISHTLKPVTEVTQRIVSDLALPYVSGRHLPRPDGARPSLVVVGAAAA